VNEVKKKSIAARFKTNDAKSCEGINVWIESHAIRAVMKRKKGKKKKKKRKSEKKNTKKKAGVSYHSQTELKTFERSA
jgi:hypothetical protein